jgi:hypothetical protein
MSEKMPTSPPASGAEYSVLSAPPSRTSNPFATCWTRPGNLPFCFSSGESAEQLVERMAANAWWGEIVGPHGCGKSTLLIALEQELCAAGRSVQSICLRDGQRWLPRGFLRFALGRGATSAIPIAHALLVIDGYEQLGWLQKVWLKYRCRRAGAGLLVTSHAPTGLPTLITLAPDGQLIEQLVATLSERVPTPVSPADVAASHACRGSNVREIFFDLYDRHERYRTGG